MTWFKLDDKLFTLLRRRTRTTRRYSVRRWFFDGDTRNGGCALACEQCRRWVDEGAVSDLGEMIALHEYREHGAAWPPEPLTA